MLRFRYCVIHSGLYKVSNKDFEQLDKLFKEMNETRTVETRDTYNDFCFSLTEKYKQLESTCPVFMFE